MYLYSEVLIVRHDTLLRCTLNAIVLSACCHVSLLFIMYMYFIFFSICFLPLCLWLFLPCEIINEMKWNEMNMKHPHIYTCIQCILHEQCNILTMCLIDHICACSHSATVRAQHVPLSKVVFHNVYKPVYGQHVDCCCVFPSNEKCSHSRVQIVLHVCYCYYLVPSSFYECWLLMASRHSASLFSLPSPDSFIHSVTLPRQVFSH